MQVTAVFRNALMASGQVFFSGGALFALYYFLLRTVGATELGIWSLVLATSSPARLSQLGLSGGVVRFVAKYLTLQDPDRASNVVQTATISIACLMLLVLLPFYFLLAPVLEYFLPAESYLSGMSLVPFALTSLWIGSLNAIFTSGLDGVLRTDLRSLIMTGGVILHLVLVVLLVPKYGLIGLGYAQVIQAATILVISWWILRRCLPVLPLFPFRWDRGVFKEIFRYGLNIQAGSIAQMFFDPTTKMLMSKFGGLDLVAYFEMANRMVTQLRGLVVSANQVLVPVFSGLNEKISAGVSKLYRRSFGLLLVVALPVFSGIIAITPIVSEIWVGSYQTSFVDFGVILAIGWFLNTLNAPAYFSNMGTGQLNWNTIGHVTVGVLNLLLGVVFGSMAGGIGVVVGFVVALVFGSSLVTFNYHMRHGIRYAKLFSREHWPLFSVSLVVPLLTWNLYRALEGSYGIEVRATLGFVLILGMFIPPIWMHPIRTEMIGYLTRRK